MHDSAKSAGQYNTTKMITSIGFCEPGRLMPAKVPSALYSATVWKSRATIDTPRGLVILGSAVGGSIGTNVAHSLPLTPAQLSIEHMCPQGTGTITDICKPLDPEAPI
jgi:hypothetical protein